MAVTVSCLHRRPFAGIPANVSQARDWTLGLLPEGCSRADDIVLVVSELFTNALLHSVSGNPGGVVHLKVEVCPDAVELTVDDEGPTPEPVPRDPSTSGWGLDDIVKPLTNDDYEVIKTDTGRTVWCRLYYAIQPHPDTPCT